MRSLIYNNIVAKRDRPFGNIFLKKYKQKFAKTLN